MKNAKRILACFLAVLMTFSCFAVISAGAEAPAVPEGASVYVKGEECTLSAEVDGVYTIDTANEFMAFANELNNGKNFSGKTIKLNCDIVINEGDATTLKEPISWTARGSGWSTRFAGSFDGNGHVISGLYSKSEDCGLFGRVAGGTTLKNVSIVNSYFESTATGDSCAVGGLIGYVDFNGVSETTTIISNVHIDATLNAAGNNVGGILGKANHATSKNIIIENSSFVGSITATGGGVGGIFGDNSIAATYKIKNCLVDADIKGGQYDTSAARVGGIFGFSQNAVIDIENCAVYGSIKSECLEGTSALAGYAFAGGGQTSTVTVDKVILAVTTGNIGLRAVLCRVWANGVLNLKFSNVKYDKDVITTATMFSGGLSSGGTLTGNSFKAEGKTSSELKGFKIFDFWNVVDGDYPTPPTTAVPDVYSGTPATDWVVDGNTIIISTAEQLMGFASKASTAEYNTKTIKLERDIIINSGDASTWGETAPAYAWITYFTWQTPFKGNFDGQGHVISGLYSKPFPAGTTGLFNIVGDDTSFKNVSIVNSYFESTAIEDNCAIGGLIGYIQHSATATSPKTVSIDNVHVDAILKAGTGRNVGGILGKPSATQAQYSTVNINNCSFTGSISTEGGFSGGLVGSNNNGAKLNITSCLVDAEISCGKYDDSNAYVGGILGYQNNNDITIENCAVYGSISSKKQSGTATLIGGINSSTGKNITVTINNVLLAVEPKSDLHAMLCKYWANGTINLAITSVKYDSTLLTSVSEKMFSAGGTGATGDTNFVAEGVATADLKGQAVFTGWTAIKGDYPLPDGVNVKDTFGYDHYDESVKMLGYQTAIKADGHSVRLVALLTHGLNQNYTAAGFANVTVTHSGAGGIDVTKNKGTQYCEYVYDSVIGGGITYTANEYLSDNLFCLAINKLPAGVVTITATPFVTLSASDDPVYGKPITWTIETVADTDLVTAMSFNVRYDLSETVGGASGDTRIAAVAAQILDYAPDVVGVQEAATAAWDALDGKLTGYTALRDSVVSTNYGEILDFGDTTKDYLTIYYLKDKYTKVESGIYKYEAEDSNCERGMHWVILKDKNNKQFLFVNTHLDHTKDSDDTDAPTVRAAQAQEMIDNIKTILTTYGDMPVVIVGDFNATSSETVHTTMANADYSNTRTDAYNIENTVGTWNSKYSNSSASASSTVYDYCYVSKSDVFVYGYKVSNKQYNSVWTSDHFPVIAELILVK